ncbi:MAG: copper amine oxidase N-terminal domain-containing protein [Armatimonadetes bacterium]|nr:copper amine oxidase N-terminal domain-containing protein [Armatimonadota bacterium]
MRKRHCFGVLWWVGVLSLAALTPGLTAPRVVVNGKAVRGVPAYVISGRVMVPVRGVIERIPDTGVQWDARRKQVWVRRGETRVKLNVGSGYAHVGGQEVPLDMPLRLGDGHTLMPLRFVAEVLGARVDWDAARQVATITAEPGQTRALAYRSAPREGKPQLGHVAIGGDTILTFRSPGRFASVEERAARVTELLSDGLADAGPETGGRFNPASLWLSRARGNPVIMLGKVAVVEVTPEDAGAHKMDQQALADAWMAKIRAALIGIYGNR